MIAFEFHKFRRPVRYVNGYFQQWTGGFVTVTRYRAGGVDEMIQHIADSAVLLHANMESAAYRETGARLH